METKEKSKRTDLLAASGRITPREVLEAYEETGWDPMFEDYMNPDAEPTKACALTAVVAATGLHVPTANDALSAVEEYVEERVGTERYREGFTRGFDGCPLIACDGWRRLGWRDGKRARAFVLGRGK